jgi:rhomboid protease GluP
MIYYKVTLILLITNLVIFAYINLNNIKPLQYYLVPIYITNNISKYLITLLTSIFIHIDAIHIAFNSIALFFLGKILEPYIGSYRFLSLYILAGISGGVLHTIYAFFVNNIYTPVIGASGAISGIIGFSAAKGDKIALFWLLTQILLGLFSGIETIAFFAHIGGFVMGYTIGKIIRSDDIHISYI